MHVHIYDDNDDHNDIDKDDNDDILGVTAKKYIYLHVHICIYMSVNS